MDIHLHGGRLQPDPPAQAAGGVMPVRNSPLLGKWRIVQMELWDADFLDTIEPAYIAFDAKGRGEFMFGASVVTLTVAMAGTA
jgi:hypothetical protein